MLILRKEGGALVVETAGGMLRWDAERGGQITEFAVKDELFTHPLLTDGDVIPGLCFVVDGRRVGLADARAELEIHSQTDDRIVLRAFASLLDGALCVEQVYEVFPEGAVFCEMSIDVPADKRVEVSDCSVHTAIDTASAERFRWGFYTRRAGCKTDATTVHAFAEFRMFLGDDDSTDARELYPLVSLDLGWAATRFFSNRLEFIIEDWTAFGGAAQTATRTRAGVEDGRWRLHRHFYEGPPRGATGPCRYRNRWALLFGTARTRAGAGADPAMRNNLLGARVAHCMYPYARKGDDWPWVVMPMRQIVEQPPQWFVGVPDPGRADEAADVGANAMIIHQFWMSNPGSNNEPVADYHPLDPEWLAAFVGRCHERGMRVGLYVRGTEMHSMYSPFFEDFMKKDWDGLYADWAYPLAVGYIKCSPLHFSAYNYFQFTRATRRRVGDGGFLVGHSGGATFLALAAYDVSFGGEVSVRHDELLTEAESSAYYSLLSCCGAHLISGNLPDRVAFSSEKARAMCSAFGMTGHPFMEPDAHFSGPAAYIKPLWDAMRELPGAVVRLHNPAFSPTRAVRTEAPDLFPSVFQSDQDKALVLVTNLSDRDVTGAVELDLRELDVPAGAGIRALNVDGAVRCRIDGAALRLESVPALGFCAALIG